VKTLLFPRLAALRREGREVGTGRAIALALLGVVFWVGAYVVTVRVLHHFTRVDPDLGHVLAAKLLALLFLLLLTFLGFSALITAVSHCFLAGDLSLIVAAPVSLRRLFRAKLGEVAVFSSWTALFLAVPVWVAYGTVYEAGALFYVALLAVITPFVLIAASLGILVAVALVNLFPARRARDLLSLMGLLFVVGIVILLRVMRPERFVRPEEFGSWAEYLVSLSNPTLPWLPSYWASRILVEILGVTRAIHWPAVGWYAGLLVGAAIVTVVLAGLVFREGFRSGFSKSLQARQVRWTRGAGWRKALELVSSPLPRRVRAIVVKDASTFFRDPSQWSQLVLLLALIGVYLYNFHVLPLDPAGGTGYLIRNLLAFLNVALVGLVVTALAARFVLPGVSLEGRTLWILHASPMSIGELVWAKFWGGFVPVLIVAELLVVLSNSVLHATTIVSVLSVVSVAFLSAAIVGMAVGLGAAHPRFDAADSTEVAAGYAGFLFMILSAILVLFAVIVLAWPVYSSFRATWFGAGVGASEWGGVLGGLVAVGALSGIALFSSIRNGSRRLRLSGE